MLVICIEIFIFTKFLGANGPQISSIWEIPYHPANNQTSITYLKKVFKTLVQQTRFN